MTTEAYDQSGGLGPYKQMIAQMAIAHGSPLSAGVAPRQRFDLQALPAPTRGIGNLSPADVVELAQGDASIFGLDSGAVGIPAGTTVTITTAPQKDCVPIRIIVSPAVAAAFAISQIQVGVDPVMITPGTNCSLAAFVPNSFAPDFRANKLRVGHTFSNTVTNLSGLAARYLASTFAVYFPG